MLFLTFLSMSNLLVAQESYQYSLEGDNIFLADIAINEYDEIGMIKYVGFDLGIVAGYDPEGASQAAFAAFFDDAFISTLHLVDAKVEWPSPRGMIAKTRRTTGCGSRGISYFDLEAGQHWDFCLWTTKEAVFTADEASNVYTFVGEGNTALFYKIARNGEVLRQYRFSGFSTGSDLLNFQSASYAAGANTIVTSGSLNDSTSFLLLTDTLGVALRAMSLEDVQIHRVISSRTSGFFALGSTERYSGLSGNARDLVLIKVDTDLNVLSSSVFFADYFNYARAELAALPDGSLALAYSTRGAYPVILAKLSQSGEIIWQKGYALYEPLVKVFSDGSLLMATRFHFDEQGRLSRKAIIAKTDTLGNIEGCETSLTCLSKDSLSLAYTDIAIVRSEEVPNLDIRALGVQDFFLQSQPFCDIPPPPSPRFELPATLCEGACLRLDSLPNRYAHGISWAVRGPGVDTVWQDSLSFDYCFERPGEYEVEQSVWFLGCAYRHAQQLTVLDSLRASVSVPAAHVCDPPPVTISVSGSRPLTEVAWGDGPATAARPVLACGTYAVTVSDGYCTAVAAGEVSFAQDSLDAELALSLPADTAVCEQSLPFVLRPASAYTDTFYLDSGPGRSFELSAPGRYSVRAEILGCAYEQPFELETSDCRAKVYLPNAFSPNGDGVNDFLFPQGDDFELLELSVFDRWGGLVYRGAGPQARWDGTGVSGRPLPSGLYVVKLAYLGTRLGEREEVWGEATLVR